MAAQTCALSPLVCPPLSILPHIHNNSSISQIIVILDCHFPENLLTTNIRPQCTVLLHIVSGAAMLNFHSTITIQKDNENHGDTN